MRDVYGGAILFALAVSIGFLPFEAMAQADSLPRRTGGAAALPQAVGPGAATLPANRTIDRRAEIKPLQYEAETGKELRAVEAAWGVEFGEGRVNMYGGQRTTPIPNPATRDEEHFNSRLQKYGTPPPNEFNALFVKSLVPGGKMATYGVQPGDILKSLGDDGVYGKIDFLRKLSLLKQQTNPATVQILFARRAYADDALVVTTEFPAFEVPDLMKPAPPPTVRYENLYPPGSLYGKVQVKTAASEFAPTFLAMAYGSQAKFQFDTYDKERDVKEFLSLAYPSIVEAYSDVCGASIGAGEATTFTPVYNKYVGSERSHTYPVDFQTNYYKQVEGKTLTLNRRYAALYRERYTSFIPTILAHYQYGGEGTIDRDMVGYLYAKIREVNKFSVDLREFLRLNACKPVGEAFMQTVHDHISGVPQKIDGDKYPARVTEGRGFEQRLYAFMPPDKAPKISISKETLVVEATLVTGTRVAGALKQYEVTSAVIPALGNTRHLGQTNHLLEAAGAVYNTGTRVLVCTYYGDRGLRTLIFWLEDHIFVDQGIVKQFAGYLEAEPRSTCPESLSAI